MCILVSAVVPTSFPEEIWRPVVERLGFGFTPREPALGESVLHLRVTRNVPCDCGTALGRELRPELEPVGPALKLPAKAKKWSAARTTRWLEERRRYVQRHDLRRFDDLERWDELLTELLSLIPTGVAPRWVGLLLHFYDVLIPFPDPPIEPIQAHERSLELLARLHEDTLYRFLAP